MKQTENDESIVVEAIILGCILSCTLALVAWLLWIDDETAWRQCTKNHTVEYCLTEGV